MLLGFHEVLVDELDDNCLELLFVSAFHDLGDALRRMFPDTLNIVAQMGNPQSTKLLENRLGLLWEGSNKMTACQTRAVSYWPRSILETIQKSGDHGSNIGLEGFLIDLSCHLGTQFRDTVASRFPDGMIISRALKDIVLAYLFHILDDDLFTLVPVDEFPSLV